MENNNEDYRLKYIEEKLSGVEDRLKGVEEMSKEFTKISTILEMQTKMNEKQDVTLGKINDNLTALNHTTLALGERVSNLEVEVKDASNRDNVSISIIIRRIGWTVLTLVIGGLVTLGFKKLLGE